MLEKLKEIRDITYNNIDKFELYMATNYKKWPDEEFCIAVEILGTIIQSVLRLDYFIINFHSFNENEYEDLKFVIQEIEILNKYLVY